MKQSKTKKFRWYGFIGPGKLSALLFGVFIGAHFHDSLMQYDWMILIAAVILAIVSPF